jgi:hypothetical protein
VTALLLAVLGLAAAPAASPTAAPPPTAAELDRLWLQRDGVTEAAALAELAESAGQSRDPQLLWRAARWYLWVSEDTVDRHAKERWSQQGWRAGELAAQLDPSCLPCRFWTALCVGVYGASVDFVTVLVQNVEARFRKPIEEVAALDPRHQNPELDFVGPQKALGRYWCQLPWPLRSLTKSRRELEAAVAARPQDLRAHLFLAETLLASGDREGARRELHTVETGPVDYDPPEARRVKALASDLAYHLATK